MYTDLPRITGWWVVNVLCMLITASVGEYVCMNIDTGDISTGGGNTSTSSTNGSSSSSKGYSRLAAPNTSDIGVPLV